MIPGFTPSESRRVRAGALVQVGWTMIAACAGAHAVAVLLVGRLLTGIGMGVSNIAFPLFVAEVAPYTRGAYYHFASHHDACGVWRKIPMHDSK